MSFLGSLTNEGLAARRGIITLFGAAGWALAWFWKEYGEPDYLRLLAGLACIAVSIGLWRDWRWARWVALGSCFLAIIAAFVMPVFLAMRPQMNAYGEHALGVELFICGSAAAIAVVAYKGLGYYRSPAAWHAFSSDDAQRTALAEESSLQVLVSAVFVATMLGFLAMVGGAATPAAESNPRKGSATKRPDLMINSLCMSGVNLVQAEVRNIGLGNASGKYYIQYSSLRAGMDIDRLEQSFGEVPPAGESTFVVLNNAANITEEDGVRHAVRLEIDYTDKIRESNENNNKADFTLIFRYSHPGNLPRCPEVPKSRNTGDASDASPPDLVVNSICMSGENTLRAEVQNLGGSGSGQYRMKISPLQGTRGAHTTWGTVPAPGRSTWITFDHSGFVRREGSMLNLTFLVDSEGHTRESREDNNSKTMPIGYDGRFLPLPPCP